MSQQTNGSTKMSANINGDMQVEKSRTLNHIYGYPVVKDSVQVVQQNPYGQKGIQLGTSAYNNLAKPFLSYLSGPYQWIHPYVEKADNFGASTLEKVDEKFPVVQKPSEELYNDAKGLVLLPYSKSMEGKDHVFQVYQDQHSQNKGNGLVTYGKSLLDTALVLTGEVARWATSYFKQAQESGQNAAHQFQDQAHQAGQQARHTAQHVSNQAQQTAGHLTGQAQQAALTARQTAGHVTGQAQQTAQQARQTAQETAQQARQQVNDTVKQ